MLESLIKKNVVLFFDESTIQSSSVKNKAWFLKGQRSIMPMPINYHTIKILAVISIHGLEAIQFFSTCNGIIITEFLNQVLKNVSQKYSQETIVIVMDNAKVNHVTSIKILAEQFNCILLYNAICSPQLNLVENLFEFLKRGIRRHYRLTKFEILSSLIQQARQVNATLIKKMWLKQLPDFYKALEFKKIYQSQLDDSRIEA